MSLEKLIEYFLRFPGIGSRQAKRFAYFLAEQNPDYIKNLSELIAEIKKDVKQCASCYKFFEESGNTKECSLCRNINRDKIIMVVEKNVDLENIERTGIYHGKYFVLGGVISLANNNHKKPRFKELFEKVKNEKPDEVIIATSATIEGENTARYIEKILESLKIKTTRLGRGLSTGTELEYIDTETMSNALKNRK
jgi:recombination protein RecR